MNLPHRIRLLPFAASRGQAAGQGAELFLTLLAGAPAPLRYVSFRRSGPSLHAASPLRRNTGRARAGLVPARGLAASPSRAAVIP